MINAFVFDAYGTLFDVHSVQSRCEEAFPGYGADLTGLWRTKQLEYTWLRSLMGRYENFWHVTQDGVTFACRSLGLNASKEQIDHLMQAYLTLNLFPEIADTLKALSSVPCAILSNGTSEMLNSVVRYAGLESSLQHVLSADEVQTYKPNPVVYQLAEKHLGIRREEIGFVSSNCWDVVGAKAFGFQAYWINRQNAPLEVLDIQLDKIIRSAMELVAVLS